MPALSEALRSAPLQSCNLIKNNFSVEAAKQLVEAAKQSKTLKSLCGKAGEKEIILRREADLKDPDAILISFDVLFNAPLSELNLGSNSFTKVGVGDLAGALAASKLTKLEIYRCGLKDDSIEVLAPALSKPPLKSLVLSRQ